ncbi:Vacuolar protein sorting-associated protein 52-like protein, partial [Stegodyphus mimosarum]
MEQMLRLFQSDLGSISKEILTLQQQSVSMNVRLKNRQAIRGELSQFVDDMIVQESLIQHILETPVTEKEFLEDLQILDHKIAFVKEQSFKDARCCQDVKDVLEKLKIKAISKIREYLLQKIYSFRKPMTNYQVPQNALLKYKFYYQFLMTHERDIARDVREEYLDTMSKILFSYFKMYTSRLMKLQFEEVADRDDLMGVEDTAKR